MPLYAWGKSSFGQLGTGSSEHNSITVPQVVEFFQDHQTVHIADVACGWNHTLFVVENGGVYSCGLNERGQLGQELSATKPGRISALETMTVQQAGCGQSHTVVLNDKGQVYAFGDNSKGQLGPGSMDKQFRLSPRSIKMFPKCVVKQVACGSNHSLALCEGGQIFSWGENTHGQLGLKTSSEKELQPQRLSALAHVPAVSIAAGGSHSFVLTVSGNVLGWGKNSFGQLGLGHETDTSIPTVVVKLRNQFVHLISCGEDHTVALTKEGGVFTFGCGTSGQLGHGSLNSESFPRQVSELMGSDVCQVACGRRHTLAYIRGSNQLYAFGLGGSGQLGNQQLNSTCIPCKVVGDLSQSSNGAHITARIFAGGNHCFSLTVDGKESSGSSDARQLLLRRQPRFIDEEFLSIIMNSLAKCNESDTRSVTRSMELLETIFSSHACLNGSFLKRPDHEHTSAMTHGINLMFMRRALEQLCALPPVKTLVSSAAQNFIVPSLPTHPEDVEALRIYLIVPEMMKLIDVDEVSKLTIHFGNCMMSLIHPAQHVLARWWSLLPGTFFTRLIVMFQNCVRSILKLRVPNHINEELFSRQASLSMCMVILNRLNMVNNECGCIVPVSDFYIPELGEFIDIRTDYCNWIEQPNVFSFCRYPFVFDAQSKAILLQTDAIIQMQFAMEEVHRINLRNVFTGAVAQPISPLLVLEIRRDHLVEDAFSQIMKHDSYDLKKPLKIIFTGEEAVDAGGVRKEFFLLLMREILDPKYGMFVYVEDSRVLWFSHQSLESHCNFQLIGLICGLAIYNSQIIDLEFPVVLYKKLLGQKPNLDDYRTLQPGISRNLQYLLDYDGDDFEDTFNLTFEVGREVFDQVEHIELKENGKDTVVDLSNREEYVGLYIDYFMNKSIARQFDAFASGFHRVCGGHVLNFFHPLELMEMVVGSQEYDFSEFEKNAKYEGEYYRRHPVIENFWKVFHEFDLEKKKKFLAFLTGSDKVPIFGMKDLKIVVQPVDGGPNNKRLPSAHTCFNILDLPRYVDLNEMRTKLMQAVEFSEGFGLV